MYDSLEKFVADAAEELGDRLVCVYEFGSRAGEEHPRISDRDLLVCVRSRHDIPEVARALTRLEHRTFGHHHSKSALFSERYLLGTNDLVGLHMIIIGADELAHGSIKSFRLKILTALVISPGIFFYELKSNARLLYGQDLLHMIKVPMVGFADRIKSFAVATIVLALTPLAAGNVQHFKVWCFKAAKYYAGCIQSYTQIVRHDDTIRFEDLGYDTTAYHLAQTYRYHPGEYKKSLIGLYVISWISLIRNLSFLWRG